ncbi:MAG: hypothetical protein WC863_03940 [Patescibacteria group bacterium]
MKNDQGPVSANVLLGRETLFTSGEATAASRKLSFYEIDGEIIGSFFNHLSNEREERFLIQFISRITVLEEAMQALVPNPAYHQKIYFQPSQIRDLCDHQNNWPGGLKIYFLVAVEPFWLVRFWHKLFDLPIKNKHFLVKLEVNAKGLKLSATPMVRSYLSLESGSYLVLPAPET